MPGYRKKSLRLKRSKTRTRNKSLKNKNKRKTVNKKRKISRKRKTQLRGGAIELKKTNCGDKFGMTVGLFKGSNGLRVLRVTKIDAQQSSRGIAYNAGLGMGDGIISIDGQILYDLETKYETYISKIKTWNSEDGCTIEPLKLEIISREVIERLAQLPDERIPEIHEKLYPIEIKENHWEEIHDYFSEAKLNRSGSTMGGIVDSTFANVP